MDNYNNNSNKYSMILTIITILTVNYYIENY